MMKRGFLVFALVLVFVGALVSPALAGGRWKTCPIKSDTNVVIYGDTGFGGVGDLSKSWMTHFMDWWEAYDGTINYVFLSDSDVASNCDFSDYPNLKLYIQPGGDAYYQQRSLGSDGKANIIDFIDNDGGAYLGVCAGAYYAAGDYYWQGDYYDWSGLLGKFPTLEGSITDIADYDENPGYALTPMDNGFEMIYYGGPTRGWRDTPTNHPGEKLMSFNAIPGDLPSAIKDGNMLLMSVHAEAYENDGISGLSTDQRIENYKWLANSINDVAGTNFYVPAYSDPPACSNGLDDDGDGLIDMADPGCSSLGDDDETDPLPMQCGDGIDNDGDGLVDWPADPGCSSLGDDDETDVVGPVEVFFDGFEDGVLDGWSLYGPGVQWDSSTDTSYEGSRSARAKKTGAGDDSFMETSIDASGYSTLTFEYYRQLVGLDAADDFEVQYYNNGQWISVEHLGSGRESNGAFVFKSFSIPSSAEKIRFKCEVGAVSEKCYVDNVRVLAE